MTQSFLHPTDVVRSLPIKVGDSIADFGVGLGHFALALARTVGEAGSVHIIDIARPMLDKVQKEARRVGIHNIYAIAGDLERPAGSTLADIAVAGVVVANVLFQAEDPKAILAEAVRVLRPGGWCAVIDWAKNREEINSFGPAKKHVLTESDVQSWANALGLSGEQHLNVGSHHFGLLFFKAS